MCCASFYREFFFWVDGDPPLSNHLVKEIQICGEDFNIVSEYASNFSPTRLTTIMSDTPF